MLKKKYLTTSNLLLAAILIVALLLRLKNITQPYIDYIDWRQVSTAMMADNYYRGNWNIFYPAVNWNGPEPAYQGREFQTISYSAALLYNLFGQQDWVGRIIAVAFGVWGVFALYCLINRVWDREHALFGSAIMAILPGSVFIERSFIPDPVMVSLVVTSVWLFTIYLQTDVLRYLILAGLIGCWGFLTKITGMIVGIPILYLMFYILNKKKQLNPRRLWTIFIAAIFTLTPVVLYYLWAKHLSETYPPYHFAGEGNWVWDDGLFNWLSQKYYLPQLEWNLNQWIWTKPVLIMAGIGCFLKPPAQTKTSDTNLPKTNLQVPWLFHVWLLAGCIDYAIGAKELVINSWNLHVINPAIAALTGHTLVQLARLSGKFGQKFAIATVTALLLLILGIGQQKLANMYHPAWDSFTNYKMGLALKKISQPEDLVVTIPTGTTEPVAIYYSQRRGWSFPPHEAGWWGNEILDENLAIELFEKLRFEGADWLAIAKNRQVNIWQSSPNFAKHIETVCKIYQSDEKWIIYQITPATPGNKLSE